MKEKHSNEKSRNENKKEEIYQKTAEPISLNEIKNISKDIIGVIKSEMDSIDSNKMLQNLVQLLHSIHEDIKKKFNNSSQLPKIEEIFDKNLELILNYFIRCFQHTDTVKISITNNIINGLSNIQNVATILTDQFLSQEKITENQISSNFIFDEEFVTLINSLSCSIKEFMKNCNSCLKVINNSSESLIDQLISSKTTISDLLLQFNNSLLQTNQMKYSQKQGGMQPTTKEKIFKDKLSSLLDKVEIISALRINLSKNLKFVDNYCTKFYDDSKVIFKKLKNLHNEKLNDIQKMNSEFNDKANELINRSSFKKNGKNLNTSNNMINQDECNDNLYQLSNNNFNNQEIILENHNENLDSKNNLNETQINENLNFQQDYENDNFHYNDQGNYKIGMKTLNNRSLKNKLLNNKNLSININNINSTGNNTHIDNVSPVNKRQNSSNFQQYNFMANDMSNFKESRSSSNPKFTKSCGKVQNLNNSIGKFSNNVGLYPNTPINQNSTYNNCFSQTTKNTIMNKSAGNFNNKKNKNPNNLSIGNYPNTNQTNNHYTENEFLVIKKNEELNKRIKELLEEITLLHDSYQKIAEENSQLKILNLNLSNLNNTNSNAIPAKNNKYLNKYRNNSNLSNKTENQNFLNNNNSNGNNPNICSNCSVEIKAVNKINKKQSGDTNNLLINTESNEINNNYNNLNTSNNSFKNSFMNVSNSDIFNLRKANMEKLIQLNYISEKTVLFIEMMHKLQDEISKKSIGIKELKINFEENKIELLKNAHDIFFKSKLEIEKDQNNTTNITSSPKNLGKNSKIGKNSSKNILIVNPSASGSNNINLPVKSKSIGKFTTNTKNLNNINILNKNLNLNSSSININGTKNKPRSYNSTILNYANKKITSNVNNLNQEGINQMNYNINYQNTNEYGNLDNNMQTEENENQRNIRNYNEYFIGSEYSLKPKTKSFIMKKKKNQVQMDNRNNFELENQINIRQSQLDGELIEEDEGIAENDQNSEEKEKDINTQNIINMNIHDLNNLNNLNNQLNNENFYLQEINENIMKEVNELREINQKLLNENEYKGSLIEESNEKILSLNQKLKLVDEKTNLNNENAQNIKLIQQLEEKINNLMNELNITKLTNEALYSQINQGKKDQNYENEENDNNYYNQNEHGRVKEMGQNFVTNELNNRDEDEKYVLNMEIEKQISENIQSKHMIEALKKELEIIKGKFENISKELGKSNETSKTIKNYNTDLEKKYEVLKEEIENRNKNVSQKDDLNLMKKIKENDDLLKEIDEYRNKEKNDKAEILKLNGKIIELDKQINHSKNSINELQIKIKMNKNERDSLSNLIEKMNNDNKNLEIKVNSLEENLKNLKNEKNSSEVKIENMNKSIKTLNEEVNQMKFDNQNLIKERSDLSKKLEKEKSEKNNLDSNNQKLNQEIKDLKKIINVEKENEEKNLNLKDAMKSLEDQISTLNSNISSKETEIKNLTNKNEELKNEIRSLSKTNDNLKQESTNFKKIEDNIRAENKTFLKNEENLKQEIKNLIKSEENLKSEVKSLIRKEENLINEVNSYKKEIQNLHVKISEMENILIERNEKIEKLKSENDIIKYSGDDLNIKIKNLCDTEGFLKLEIEKHTMNENNYKNELKKQIEKENNLKIEMKNFIKTEENLKSEIKNLLKENESYKEIFKNNSKNEEEKVMTLTIKINELESNKNSLNKSIEEGKLEIERLKNIIIDSKKENESLKAKIKDLEKTIEVVKAEKYNFMAEVENLKVLTEDYDQKCNRISELEGKISKLKKERDVNNNEEIKKLNKSLEERQKKIAQIESDYGKLEKEIIELNTNLSVSNKMQSINTNKNNENLENEKKNLIEANENLNNEISMIQEEKKKFKNLRKKQMDYLMNFVDKFFEINENAINNIDNINSSLSNNNYAYQIPKLDSRNEINLESLKDIFPKLHSNDINESYNATMILCTNFIEDKVFTLVLDMINQNIANISGKFIKFYEDMQLKLTAISKTEKESKTLADKFKNAEIEKLNLSTLLEGKDQECDQISFKLADVEKKFKNFRESQKSSNEKLETKAEIYEKENKKLHDAISRLQAELELVIDENEKLKNEKDKLNNLETCGFGNFVLQTCPNLPSSFSGRNNSNSNSKNNLLLLAEEAKKQQNYTLNNNSENSESKQKLIKLEEKYNELLEDNKKLKIIFDESTQTIYDAIKNYSPNLFEDPSEAFIGGNSGQINNRSNMLTINNVLDSRGSLNSNYSFSTDKDLISKAVDLFKKYNKEINEKNKQLEKELAESQSNCRMYKIMSEEYKNAWEFTMKKSDKINFENLQIPNNQENLLLIINENMSQNQLEKHIENMKKENLLDFTVEDLIEAGELNLESGRSNKKENTTSNITLMQRKISGNNLNLNLLNSSSNNNFRNDSVEKFDKMEENDNFFKLIEKQKADNMIVREECFSFIAISNHEDEIKINFNSISSHNKDGEKFNFSSYLEKFNNPSEYKILAYKKLSNELIWYLLVYKHIEIPAHHEIDHPIGGFSITSNINEVDLNMINKIKRKTSNNQMKFDDDHRPNLHNNLPKNYESYMWVPGKLIANNLISFDFEKNHNEHSDASSSRNNNKDKNSNRNCVNCEKNKKDSNKNLYIEELEKKYTSMLDEKDTEIKELLGIQDDLVKKLAGKGNEIANYKETCDKLLKASINSEKEKEKDSSSKFVSLEKYEALLNEFKEEQDKAYELMNVYEQLKTDHDNMAKKMFNMMNYNVNKETIETKAMNKSFNNKNINQMKDLNDVEIDDLLQMHNRNSLGGLNDMKEFAKKYSSNFNTVPAGGNNKSNSNHIPLVTENENDFNLNKTDGYYMHDNIKEAVNDLEQNEKLLMDQLVEIKEELKQTRNERDTFKKKYNESITLQDGKKNEILNILKSAVEKLIAEITLTPKIKELLAVILRICDIDDEEINTVFKEKEKAKKSFFGFMSKK